MLFTLLHKLTIGFAMLGVVNGIFIQETFKVAACDDHVLLLQKDRETKWIKRKMTALFDLADTSHDGVVDKDELQIILENDQIRKWLATQGLATSDEHISNFCDLLCENKEELTLEDFLRGVDRLKGAARSMDLAMLSSQQIRLEKRVLANTQAVQDVRRQSSTLLHPQGGSGGTLSPPVSRPVSRAQFSDVSKGTVEALPKSATKYTSTTKSTLPQSASEASVTFPVEEHGLQREVSLEEVTNNNNNAGNVPPDGVLPKALSSDGTEIPGILPP
jgi:hypothetical protein